jgi:hypothetical protein
MIRKNRESGKDSFELIPEKASRLHDDRAYTAALCSYALMLERRKQIIPGRKKQTNIKDMFRIRKPIKVTRYS